MENITVIGAGSWGTSISIHLSQKHNIFLWDNFSELLDSIKIDNENTKYLPNIKFNKNIKLIKSLKEAIKKSKYLVFAIPTQFLRQVLKKITLKEIENKKIINLAKGIETSTLKRCSEIFFEIFENKINKNYCLVTGPSHAEEVALKKPTLVTAVSKNKELSIEIQKLFNTKNFRVYTNNDLTGSEIGGSIKNIIAIASGICDGLDLGINAKAALITRGLAEIIRFADFFGGDSQTLSGLSGLGDLIVTCDSKLSRNYRCGLLLSKNFTFEECKKKIGQVIEGGETVKSVYELSKKNNISMPISEQVYFLITKKCDAKTAVKNLLERISKPEFY